ncbi:hypothetical protein P7E02_12420 [Enterococcus hulanensis]|uniref:hypothetical protein n=1 Tax=Enterococcus hulanensis TaxID=2559929 RepID=UPI00288D783F|nr:hypothetical protein [Enterococcus hulanensis]MDT2660679.1 hypothetical protein [Enterococcus hulanensis]
MGKFIDLSSQRFGRLLVIDRNGTDKFGHATFLCKCDCGNEKTVDSHSLRQCLIQSCGCLQAEKGPDAIKARQEIKNGIKPSYFQTDKPQSNNRSGIRGVTQYKKNGKIKYRAQLTVNGTVYQKSGFTSLEAATECREQLVEKYLPKD